jgi:hypothetical protein
MKANEYEVIGEFNTSYDLETACKQLEILNIEEFDVELVKDTESPLQVKKEKYRSINDLLILLISTVIPATSLGIYSLFSFWDLQSKEMTLIFISIFTILGGVLGYFVGSNVLSNLKVKNEKSKLHIRVDDTFAVAQTKSILNRNNAIDIKVN